MNKNCPKRQIKKKKRHYIPSKVLYKEMHTLVFWEAKIILKKVMIGCSKEEVFTYEQRESCPQKWAIDPL